MSVRQPCCEREDDHSHEVIYEDGQMVYGPAISTAEALSALAVAAERLNEEDET